MLRGPRRRESAQDAAEGGGDRPTDQHRQHDGQYVPRKTEQFTGYCTDAQQGDADRAGQPHRREAAKPKQPPRNITGEATEKSGSQQSGQRGEPPAHRTSDTPVQPSRRPSPTAVVPPVGVPENSWRSLAAIIPVLDRETTGVLAVTTAVPWTTLRAA